MAGLFDGRSVELPPGEAENAYRFPVDRRRELTLTSDVDPELLHRVPLLATFPA
jgi:hypothetical protein